MIIRLILALAAILVLFFVYRRWRALPPKERKNTALQGLIYTALVVVVLAVLTGRLHWLGALLAGLLAFAKIGFSTLLRLMPFLNILRRSPFFSNPVFKTSFLEVHLDLKNGQISGAVISGPLAGKQLGELTTEELLELQTYYQSRDKASFYLIRVIQQRAGQKFQQEKNYASVSDPSVEEAFQILGLSTEATKNDVIKAHRSLIQKLHPDRGGNDYLASRINLAKETLVKYLEHKGKT